MNASNGIIKRKGEKKVAESQLKNKELDEEKTEEVSIKGTLASVMLLGGFLIISWFGVWILYLIR